MSGRSSRSGAPVISLPIDEVFGGSVGESLPPHVAVISESDVGKDGVSPQSLDGGGVGRLTCSGGDTKESSLGVDRPQAPIVSDPHPDDVVADGFDDPTRNRRPKHGEVGLAAGAGESGGDVEGAALRGSDLEEQHVLGKPALFAGHHRGYAESKRLLRQQSIPAIGGSERPNLPGFRKVADVLCFVAGPGDIGFANGEGRANRVTGSNPAHIVGNCLAGGRSHAGHDAGAHHDVGGVGELNSEASEWRTDGAHREWHDVEGAPSHAAGEESFQSFAHLFWLAPVVVGSCIDLEFR